MADVHGYVSTQGKRIVLDNADIKHGEKQRKAGLESQGRDDRKQNSEKASCVM